MTPDLLAILVCPKTKQPLTFFPAGAEGEEAFFLSAAGKLRYRVEAGVPVLLVDEAQSISTQEVARLVERAKALGAK